MYILLAYIHLLSFAVLISSLIAERVLFQERMSARAALLIKRADIIYGIAAGAMILSGLLRMRLGQGVEYYQHNGFFWIKMAVFLVTGLLSVYPTVRFLKWKPVAADEFFAVSAQEAARIRLFMNVQLALFPAVPLCAVLMARGFG